MPTLYVRRPTHGRHPVPRLSLRRVAIESAELVAAALVLGALVLRQLDIATFVAVLALHVELRKWGRT